MTMRRLYTVAVLAVLATQASAFRRNVAGVLKTDSHSVFEAEPPAVEAMLADATTVIDAKIAAAEAALAGAQKKMMDLSMATAGSNNTNKGMLMHEAVDAMMAANVEKATAITVKGKVKEMVEACTTLFTAVVSFKTNSEPRAAHTKTQIEKHVKDQVAEIKKAAVDTERIDLQNLLDLVRAIAENEKLVKDLDKEVGAGAAPGIVGATSLVYQYETQLKERQATVTTADALFKMPPLTPEDAQLRIEPQFGQSLEAASTEIERIIKEKEQLVLDANSQLMVVAGSVEQSNATRMHEIIDELMAANQAKAKAVELGAAIDVAIPKIENFFTMFAGYRSKEAQKKQSVSDDVDKIISNGDDIVKATEASVLLEVGAFFRFYQLMWVRALEAGKAIPVGDADFATIAANIDTNAEAVHEWLNNEMTSLCTYYTTCTAARAALLALAEVHVDWCDERTTLTACRGGSPEDTTRSKDEQPPGGQAPNGKMCSWTPPNHEINDRIGTCSPVSPPTANMKWGRDGPVPPGVGIFY